MKQRYLKIAALILTIQCCLLAWGNCFVWAEEATEEYVYTIENGGVRISQYSGTEKNLVIPDTIEGYPVTYIDYGFAIHGTLESITLPDSVTGIHKDAFQYCEQLQSIVVYDSNPNYSTIDGVLLTKDGTELVRYPKGKLGDYTVPDGVKSIGEAAFSKCKGLTGVTLPDGVTEMNGSAFSGCINLAEVTLPDSIISFGDSVFSGCENLTVLVLPKRLTAIGAGAFFHCKNLTEITIPEGVTRIADMTFYTCDNLERITLPDGITDIGEGAFYGCAKLREAFLPEALESIGYEAFRGCSSLEQLFLSQQVNTIAYRAFWECTGLKAITVDEKNVTYCDVDGVLMNKEQTQLLLYPAKKQDDTYKVPESVIAIEENAFQGCDALKVVELPVDLTEIGQYAFLECIGLESVTIPANVINIDVGVFESCSNLQRVVFPESLQTIGNSAFQGCASLQEVVIPENVTKIESSAFFDCDKLTEIRIPDSVTDIGTWAFADCDVLQAIVVGQNNTQYCSIDGVLLSKDGTELLQCPGGKIGDYSIPNGVSVIKEAAFYGCGNLMGITFPDSVEALEYTVFYGCTNLKQITVAEANPVYCSVDGVLFNKEKSTLIKLPTAMEGSYSIPDSVTEIETDAFAACMLAEITIPQSVKSIADYAFYGCDNLQWVIYTGEEGDWNTMLIQENNAPLLEAERIYQPPIAVPEESAVADVPVQTRQIQKSDPNRPWKIGGLSFVALWAIAVVVFLMLRKRANKKEANQ